MPVPSILGPAACRVMLREAMSIQDRGAKGPLKDNTSTELFGNIWACDSPGM
jgi:hypothetical protein